MTVSDGQPTILPLSDYPDPDSVRAWSIADGPGELEPIADTRAVWAEEIAGLPEDAQAALTPDSPTWNWVIYPWLRSATTIPDQATTYSVLTSRNYPIISRSEQRLLAEAHVVIVGLSTGRAVAQQLARIGVGSMHLADGDTLAPSNTNRLTGTRLTDMTLPKSISTARELAEYNPWLSISAQTTFMDAANLTSHLRDNPADVIVEMIDELPAKITIRKVAEAHGVPVVTATGMDWDPMIDIEYPDDPPFGGRLTDSDLATIESPTATFAEKTEVAMRLMSLPKWAPRSFLSGQYARNGLVKYWSQTVPAVGTCASLVTAPCSMLSVVSALPKPEP